MTLDELIGLGLPTPPPRVPSWSLGCWRRRAITFFNGLTDTATAVVWIQSHGLTFDLRLAPDRPRAPFDQCTDEEQAARLAVEGGLAATAWDGTHMSWSDWTSFQLHDKWPEPGRLQRTGDCLIEVAPSGAYVEDWRLQPSAPGPLVGLRLIEERDLDTGEIVHRGGGLLIAGDHAGLVRGRPTLARNLRAARANARDWRAILACEASYARRTAAGFEIVLSTDPAREGDALALGDDFSHDPGTGQVRQRLREDGRNRERLFSIDTLLPHFVIDLATPATADARAWLEREQETLLRHAGNLATRVPSPRGKG